MNTITVARPDIPFLVDLDAIWYARIRICEYTPVSERLSSGVDIERVAEETQVRT